MIPKLSTQINQIILSTQLKFHQYIQPTIITQSQFNQLFKYRKAVGQGSYGAIKCIQNYYNQTLAIKQSKDNNQQTYGLYREVAIMKKFNHPNLLQLKAFYQIKQSSKLIILTQFCKYKSLKDFSPILSSLSIQDKIRLSIQIFNGIYALHSKNIMHRDLKPQNVLIDENRHAKICDFGFGEYDLVQDLSKTRRVGTPLYNSPQTQQGQYTKKCDIFSYGLIVYYIFSNGKHLFKRFETYEQLKGTRRQHFKLGRNVYKQLDILPQIKQLLEKTITQKQKQRYNYQDVKQLWINILQRKNIKRLIEVGQLLNGQGYNKIQQGDNLNRQQNNDDRIKLMNSEKMCAQIMLRGQQNKILIQDSRKVLQIYEQMNKIVRLIGEFKQIIQRTQIKLSYKNIVSYGCLLMIQVHLQRLFSQSNKLLYKNINTINSIKLTQSIQRLINQIIKIKSLNINNLTKINKYLSTYKHLIKPQGLFPNYMINTLIEIKRLQQYMGLVSNIQSINEYKIANEIQSNIDVYKMIEQKYHLKIELIQFMKQFDECLLRYRRQKSNVCKDELVNDVNEIVNKIKRIQQMIYN